MLREIASAGLAAAGAVQVAMQPPREPAMAALRRQGYATRREAQNRAAPPATASRSPPAPAPVRVRTEPEAAKANSAPAALPHGAHFSWPLNGRILAGYGVAAAAGRNDGISIAAPRGAPIAAIEAGTVAYAGNELRGYGNLILIKHTAGWISAYGQRRAARQKG